MTTQGEPGHDHRCSDACAATEEHMRAMDLDAWRQIAELEEGTLTEFLLARITEDEAWLVDHGHFTEAPEWVPPFWKRVERECEAKRRIVHDLDEFDTPEGRDGGEFFGLEIAVQHMASVYADHPDYREEWKP